MHVPSARTLRAARLRLREQAHRTPVLRSSQLDRRARAQLFFKAENFQRAGAFKFRGAFNAVASLLESDPQTTGVVTHSSGNHAQALALAARLHQLDAQIVVPDDAPRVKLAAIRSYGANVSLCEPTLDARQNTARELMAATGSPLIHPYDDPRIIAGQASAAAELLEQVSDLDLVLAPVGGGGLLSGTALTCSYDESRRDRRRPLVIGAEPRGADDAKRSFEAGVLLPSINPETIADGLRTQLSDLTFGIIRAHVDRILTAEEADIVSAMHLVWERMKIVIEPSAAVPVAVALSRPRDFENKRIGVILSGGNVDLKDLPWL